MRWRCDAFHASRLVVPTIPAVTVHLLRFQEDRFSWLTKIAKETRGVLTFPPRAPQNLPGPCVARVCCPLRSVCVTQNIFQFQRASRGHGLLRTTRRYDASSNTLSRSVANTHQLSGMWQDDNVPCLSVQTQMPAHTLYFGGKKAKAVSSPACSD
jgi:hypothetical protein